MEIDPELLTDIHNIACAFGLETIANDLIVTDSGTKHRWAVDRPNVTRFPQIWETYLDRSAA